MEFGERLTKIRKEKKMSQQELAKKVGIHPNVLGRYERGEARPFVEMGLKLSQALNVSADYFLGNSDLQIDDTLLKRIMEVQKLPEDIQEKVFYVIDVAIKDFKTRQAYS